MCGWKPRHEAIADEYNEPSIALANRSITHELCSEKIEIPNEYSVVRQTPKGDETQAHRKLQQVVVHDKAAEDTICLLNLSFPILLKMAIFIGAVDRTNCQPCTFVARWGFLVQRVAP